MNKLVKKLLQMDGVVGVGRGSIVIYVESDRYIDAMPKYINGKPVKIIPIGRVGFCDIRKSKVRPVVGGISIGRLGIDNAGTLGMIDYSGNIITCTHVIGFSNLSGEFSDKGVVIQPGEYDGGNSECRIGDVEKISKWEWNSDNYENNVDFALASCSVRKLEGEILAGKNSVYKIKGWGDCRIGDVLRKSGRTSGVTFHRVIDTDATLKVHLSEKKYAVFSDVVIVVPPILPGDSGSIFDKDGVAVGIGFAGSDKIGAFIKMRKVYKYINLEFAEVSESKPKKINYAGLTIPMALFAVAGGLYAFGKKSGIAWKQVV